MRKERRRLVPGVLSEIEFWSFGLLSSVKSAFDDQGSSLSLRILVYGFRHLCFSPFPSSLAGVEGLFAVSELAPGGLLDLLFARLLLSPSESPRILGGLFKP